MENWHSHPDFPKYVISDHGRVRNKKSGRLLRSPPSQAYATYDLMDESNQRRRWLGHRLIWETFRGPIPPGMQINHINAIKWDNHIENLEVVTPRENIRHSVQLNLHPTGDRHGSHLHPELRCKGDRHWSRRDPEKVKRGKEHWAKQKPELIKRGGQSWPSQNPDRLARGARVNTAKLTEADIPTIRQRLASGETATSVARDFNVTRHSIYNVFIRRTWAHVA